MNEKSLRTLRKPLRPLRLDNYSKISYMKKQNLIAFGMFLLMLLPFASFGQETSKIKHSFFVAGPQFTGIISENGEEIWDSEKPKARDGYVLENGNILICWADEVKEFDSDKNVVFQYSRAEESMELGTAIRLQNGNTMITESGTAPRIVEVDPKGAVLKSIPLAPETDNIHMQTRMARKLENGNYLVPHLLAFAVKEYTQDGEIVNSFSTDFEDFGGREAKTWPFTAIRLENGNTLTTLTNGNRVIEWTSEGNVDWMISNSDFEGDPLADPCGAQRLPNGNTVIASYGQKEGVKLFEVDRNKNIVWSYSGHNVHHFQILTTNGKPLKGTPLK